MKLARNYIFFAFFLLSAICSAAFIAGHPGKRNISGRFSFMIQLGAFREKSSADRLSNSVSNLRSEPGPHGLTRYLCGPFSSYREALSAKQELVTKGFKDAFIVTYLDEKRYSLYEDQSWATALGADSIYARTSSPGNRTTARMQTMRHSVPSRKASQKTNQTTEKKLLAEEAEEAFEQKRANELKTAARQARITAMAEQILKERRAQKKAELAKERTKPATRLTTETIGKGAGTITAPSPAPKVLNKPKKSTEEEPTINDDEESQTLAKLEIARLNNMALKRALEMAKLRAIADCTKTDNADLIQRLEAKLQAAETKEADLQEQLDHLHKLERMQNQLEERLEKRVEEREELRKKQEEKLQELKSN